MRAEIRDLISSNFLAFSLKAFATLNVGKELPTEPYLELLFARLQRLLREAAASGG